ncbi:MAG: DUF2917 domain-containing protein [Blastocatellia bacterium]
MISLVDNSVQNEKKHFETDQFGLKKGELWKSPNNFHLLSIDCQQGTLWITQAGDIEDHLIEPGQSFKTLTSGLVVMQSLSDCACVSVLSN